MSPSQMRFLRFGCLIFQTDFGFMILVVRPCLVLRLLRLSFGLNGLHNVTKKPQILNQGTKSA